MSLNAVRIKGRAATAGSPSPILATVLITVYKEELTSTKVKIDARLRELKLNQLAIVLLCCCICSAFEDGKLTLLEKYPRKIPNCATLSQGRTQWLKFEIQLLARIRAFFGEVLEKI